MIRIPTPTPLADDVRQAVFDKAMREGAYRVQVTGGKIKSPVPRAVVWLAVVGNMSGSGI